MFRPILAAAVVLLLAGEADAQFGASVGGDADAGHAQGECERYAAEALAAAKRAKELNCGFPAGVRYSTNESEGGVGIDHLTFCQSHTRDEVQEEKGKRARQMNNCAFCRQATTDIVNDAQEARHLSCGFGGGRWREDSENLFGECFASRQNAFGDDLAKVTNFVNGERQARRASLFECRQQLGEDQIAKCNAYADGVLKQVGFNRMMRCGDTPASASTNSRWSADREFHFRWCTANSRGNPGEITKLMQGEEAARDNVNRLCKERMSTDPLLAACEGFAKKAVAQANHNADQKCGGTGTRWSKNFDFHYAWCIENTWTHRNDITSWRTGEDKAREENNSWCHMRKMVKSKARPEMRSDKSKSAKGSGGQQRRANTGSAATSTAKASAALPQAVKPRSPAAIDRLRISPGEVVSPGLPDGGRGIVRARPAPAGSPGAGAAGGSATGSATSYSAGTGSSGSFGGSSGGGLPRGSNSGTR
jgi:hypothetical protein